MGKLNAREKRICIVAALLILTAMTCRISGKMGFDTMLLGYLRAGIYICLFTAWGVSLKRRIMQPQVRQLMVSIAAIMVIWLLTRTIKFNIDCPPVERQLWYFYYFPMLFIPMLSVLVAFSLGKPERFRLPVRKIIVSVSITLALFLLVLTNDFHQLVFTFPVEHPVWTDYHYGYGAGYYIVVAWMLLCALTAFTVMALKCRVPHSRTVLLLPFFPIACTLAYAVLYILRFPPLYFLIGDITVIFCLLFAATLESGIQCGLIQSNTGYDMLLELSSMRAQIVDEAYVVRYSSAPALPLETMRQAEESGRFRLDRNTLLKSHPIHGGHVLWQEDITELADVMERLEDNREQLAERNYLERENYETKRKIGRLQEKNRLYDLLQKNTARQNDMLCALLDEYEVTEGEARRRLLLARIAVIGAYVKRSGNLLFLRQQSERIAGAELAYAIEESLDNLKLLGAEGGLAAMPEDMTLPAEAAVQIYEFFEAAVEAALDDLRSIFVTVRLAKGRLLARLEVESGAELSHLADRCDACVYDEGVWRLALSALEGGAASCES